MRELRKFHRKFSSVVDLKVKLLEELEEFMPPNISFSVGYYEGRQSTKYWLCTPDDLDAMYRMYNKHPGKEVSLWCEGRSTDKLLQNHQSVKKR